MAKKVRSAGGSLKGKWGLAIGGFLLYALVVFSISFVANLVDSYGVLSSLLSLLFFGPLSVGLSIFFLAIVRNKEADIDQIFEGFSVFLTSFLAGVFSYFLILLGFIFLIVPGIIVALSLSMTYFVIADNRSISAVDALKKSAKMMKGHKGSLFVLWLKFFLLFICGILTLGIAFIWIGPYVAVSLANFYESIRKKSK